jgi:hypothetical protein
VAEPTAADKARAAVLLRGLWDVGIDDPATETQVLAHALADERARAAAIARAFAGGTGQITYSWSKEQSERIAAAIERGETP